MEKQNPMREVSVEKVTVNIGVGEGGEKLENAVTLLERLTGIKPVKTKARTRNPTFKIRMGDNIGAKATLRGTKAMEFIKKALDAAEHRIKERSFDKQGNFSFGVHEYIDFPGAKYDPKIGIIGFDVCVSLKRRGWRVKYRKRGMARIGKKHRIGKEDAVRFVKEAFKAEVVE